MRVQLLLQVYVGYWASPASRPWWLHPSWSLLDRSAGSQCVWHKGRVGTPLVQAGVVCDREGLSLEGPKGTHCSPAVKSTSQFSPKAFPSALAPAMALVLWTSYYLFPELSSPSSRMSLRDIDLATPLLFRPFQSSPCPLSCYACIMPKSTSCSLCGLKQFT